MKAVYGTLVLACLFKVSAAHSADPDPAANPLSGPSVREPGVPGNSTTFTGNGRRDGERTIDHRTFLKAIEALRDASSPADVRLTRDQDDLIAAIEREFRIATRAYFEKNLNDIRDVRDVLQIRGDQPATESTIRKGVDQLRRNIVGSEQGDDDSMSEAAIKEAAREKARRIYQGGPRASEAHSRVWKMLRPAQRDALSAKIDELVNQQEAQRRAFLSPAGTMGEGAMTDPMVSQMSATSDAMNATMGGMNKGDSGQGARPMSAASGSSNTVPRATNDPSTLLGMDPARIAADDPRLPERVRRRIRSMKPEARVEAIGRYLADLKQELAETKAASESDKSAAPTVDRVNVPTPEKK